MSSKMAIDLRNVSKVYNVYKNPIDRLLQMLPWNKNKTFSEEFWALRNIDLEVKHGEVIGVVGQNGAGKSTLLQLICQTLQATHGDLKVDGKIAALLELGSGFNPEFSGRENVYMSAAIAGLSKEETDKKYDDIVKFAGIEEFIDNPVKNYSSGMMLRLAFAVATSVEPDILVIDEALSVGDGAFARKSFDRIMQLKETGCTILFCSHSLYQVEVLCKKVMWINKGSIEAFGEAGAVINMYQKHLDTFIEDKQPQAQEDTPQSPMQSNSRIQKVEVSSSDGQKGNLDITSDTTDIIIEVSYVSDLSLPSPSIGVLIMDDQLKNITSCGSFYDGIQLSADKNARGKTSLTFPKIGLLRGKYSVHVFLMCENALHIYDEVQCSTLNVAQKGSEVGIVSLPREWK